MAGEESSSRTYSTVSDDIVIGIDDKLYNIKDRLTGYSRKLEVLSVLGMGGIGKTTLARKIYDHSSIADHFYVRVWTTLSQKYQLVDILLGLVQEFCQTDILNINDFQSSRDVGEQLWKCLKKRRYLVVIDDIWDVEAWEKLRIFFPNDGNGSRIILTSRNVQVAKYASPNYPPYELSLMDPETSWELLSKKVFLRDSCPEELFAIGKKIALKCQGLPLAISMVAGHLSKVGKTFLDWLDVEKQLPSVKENVLDILALSYNFLPVHLKKCFLFAANEYAKLSTRGRARRRSRKLVLRLMRHIMWDRNNISKSEILEFKNQQFWTPTKKLLSLWIAAGYIHAEAPRSLEDVAEECLQELVRRNLVIVTNGRSSGIPKSYIVHDLMIDMYRRLDGERVGRPDNYSHGKYPFAFFGDNEYDLYRVLQSSSLNRGHLKRLEISDNIPIPTFVYKFYNLQTLIIRGFPGETLPRDILMMSQLRHLHVGDFTCLPSPRQSHTEECGIPVLKNLRTVTLSSVCCTQEICEGIPNIRSLKLYEVGAECNLDEQSPHCLNNLCFLPQLQNLRLNLQNPIPRPRCLRHWTSPPPSLRNLTLEGTWLAREDITILASLPNLEVLKLKKIEIQEWLLEHDDDIFHKLKFLLLECPILLVWKANSNNFPNLQHLVLSNCSLLCRIPLEMGEICTLQVIELYNCRIAAEESAKKIQQEQSDELGNDDFKVHISRSSYQKSLLGMEGESSTSNFLHRTISL